MEIFKALIVAICLSCGSAVAQPVDRSHECYRSLEKLRVEFPEGHARHHRTPEGMCYHIGGKNRSTNFTATKTYGKAVSGSSKTMEVRKKVDVPQMMVIPREFLDQIHTPEWKTDAHRHPFPGMIGVETRDEIKNYKDTIVWNKIWER